VQTHVLIAFFKDDMKLKWSLFTLMHILRLMCAIYHKYACFCIFDLLCLMNLLFLSVYDLHCIHCIYIWSVHAFPGIRTHNLGVASYTSSAFFLLWRPLSTFADGHNQICYIFFVSIGNWFMFLTFKHSNLKTV